MQPKSLIEKVNPDHVALLRNSLRSPSAHNAQPWKIKPLDDQKTYELHYDHNDYLPDDPDDRDAYLTMGAFVETMVLEAPNFGLEVSVKPKLTRSGDDLFVAEVCITPHNRSKPVDALSKYVSKRNTNRNHYTNDPLGPELEAKLTALGNKIFNPVILKDILIEASMKSWNNPRFVHDLRVWYRKDAHSPDGFTSRQMHLSTIDTAAMKFAFWRKQLKSKLIERLYSTRDVAMFTAAPRAAVLGADGITPDCLFDAGRRLLRSWVTITEAGFANHPFSIAIDEKSTAPKVAQITGVPVPVALYRIGKTTKSPRAISNRKQLEQVLIP